MTATTIRTVGPYTVTTDGNRIYVNGQHATPLQPPAGSALMWVLDTGCYGANGKRDYVGLTAEHYQIHVTARAALLAAPKSLASQRKDLVRAIRDLVEMQGDERRDAIESLRRTGRTTVTPARAAEIAAARAALAAFDAAHPHVKAEVDAARAAEHAEIRSSAIAEGRD